MKLWQKLFIGTLIIFIIAFNAGVLYLTNYSYNFNRQKETDHGIREQEVILSSVTGRISNAEQFFTEAPFNYDRLTAIIEPIANFYKEQGVLLALFDNANTVFTDIPVTEDVENLLKFESLSSKNIMEKTIEGKRHILVASRLTDYPHLTFIYARDISDVDEFRADISRAFAIVNVAVLAFLGISIFFLLRHMTKPINVLIDTTNEIADGAYDKRAKVKSRDELRILARSFNKMAASIEENMTLLTKSAEEKQQFIDDLTHEIKTPLTSLIGYSEYLLAANCTERERTIAVGHLYDTALRLKNLSEKLLDLAYSRDENIEWERINISGLLDELTVMVLPVLAPRDIKLTTQSELTLLTGERTLILSMIQNLVENAARASEDGSEILVRAYMEDFPVIEVTDKGCGMSKLDAERIMAPFYRVDKSRSRKFGGVGLGLSIVTQIASLHGATIEVESKVGIGTRIKVKFTSH
ncbi:MAG: HAMP domain-containing histidine kinase [Oscillospiraceae bacterium]|nr:HAMP domain-containing histidine kinase [Oscillospiraceae bacterium]